MRRRLSLRRESLADLTPGELVGVNGAAYEASTPNLLCRTLEPSGEYMCTWQPTRCLCP